MSSNKNGSGAAHQVALPGAWVVAAAVALGMLAVVAVLLTRPGAGNAAPEKVGPVVSTASTGLGRVLVSSGGKTLYLFGKDKNGKSSCSGMCAKFWPPLVAAGKPRAAAGAKASLLGTTKRADGRMQVTYNRHPVYMFVQDTKKGETKGEGVSAFGAVWDAVSPAGAKVIKHSAPPAGGGGAYGP